MSDVFELSHDDLSKDPTFAPLAEGLGAFERIDSGESFNRYCREAVRLWGERAKGSASRPSPEFRALLGSIDKGAPDTIRTGWGGVVVTLHEPPHVEKLLVVRKGGYFALEKHAEKDEHLEVREGAGLLLSRQETNGPLVIKPLAAGEKFHFAPGVEHCLIGTDNLLVFERSTDPKGMDQDLIFLYEPDGVAA